MNCKWKAVYFNPYGTYNGFTTCTTDYVCDNCTNKVTMPGELQPTALICLENKEKVKKKQSIPDCERKEVDFLPEKRRTKR